MNSLSCIMIVDDSEPDQFLCKITLEKEYPEITVLQAYDGEEALELLGAAEHQPDVIFLDINMPGMDGFEFLEVYKQKRKSGVTVVVMLTSSEHNKDKEKCMTYEFVRKYMTKPLSPTDIAEAAKLIA